MKGAQTLCPYSLDPLSKIKTNEEHIVPMGVGAPENFTVTAAMAENSRLNEELDSLFVNSSYVRYLAVLCGARSRSGDVSLNVNGKCVETNTDLSVDINSKGITPNVKKHTTKNEDGTYRIKIIDHQESAVLSGIMNGLKKKGMVGEVKNKEKTELGLIEFTLDVDVNIVKRSIIKSAYLFLVNEFGDDFILSCSGGKFRRAINYSGSNDLDNFGLDCKLFPNYMDGGFFNRFKNKDEHTLSLIVGAPGGNIIVYVSILGGFDGLFRVPSNFGI
ncbi:TPA: hypothetical protein ACSP7Z_001397, partial [Serratia fonticola]